MTIVRLARGIAGDVAAYSIRFLASRAAAASSGT